MKMTRHPAMTASCTGFTLIELMIAVAVVAIIAAVAFPSYQSQLRKTRRSDAIVALTEAAQLQERNFTRTGSYLPNASIDKLGGDTSPEGYYDITTATADNEDCTVGAKLYCFTLTATAIGVQASDTDCATMTLNEKGQKGSTGGGDCW